MLQITLKPFGRIIPLHVYGRTAADVTRVKIAAGQVEVSLRRMPALHVAVLDPIFVVDRRPGGVERDGGYWRPTETAQWLGRDRNTGVPDADVQRYVRDLGNRGIIAMTAIAWASPTFLHALFHEIAHSVDAHLDIKPPGARVEDFAGVPNPGRKNVGEFAAQAYQRWILGRTVCTAGPTCTASIIAMLRRSPTFASLPQNWRPGDG